MNRLLLDTNAYVAFKRGDTGALDIIRHAEHIAFSTVVLGELLAGFALGTREARNRTELAAFLQSPRVTVRPVDETTSGFYAHAYLALRRRGKPIPSNDLWVAATALQHGLALFSYDEHFRHVDGLVVGCALADFLP
ncbi:MAG: type II toxin-antitoxin system VapC family toxin [Candidatus Binatia bacterium]